MGKEAGEQLEQPPGAAAAEAGGGGRRRCSRCRGSVRLQCVAALLLGAAVMLSALFWLPPFAGRGRRAGPPDPPEDALAADIVASFMLRKTVSELNESTPKLEFDIYEEIGIPNSTVAVNFLQPLGASNWTNVIFSVVPFPKYSTISSTVLSILRSYFMSLVVEQSTLHLTESLFGNSSFFELLKFPGGITIIPTQAAFLVQKPYASFNFTLNFPICKVQDKINELKDQMKAGLLLNPYELIFCSHVLQNLYIKLTNLQGSTVAPPTIVRTSIILEVGNDQPSIPRMKQLAQNIANSSSGNLGLNHTVFGRVKQISLSSYLRHSLHSRSDAPSPAPMTHQDHCGHHHHHHHHHHDHNHHGHHRSHEVKKHLAPSPAPVRSPVERSKYRSPPPSGYSYRYTNKPKYKAPVAPVAEPAASNHRYALPSTMPHAVSPSSITPSPSASHSTNNPNRHHSSPAPSPASVKPPLRAISLAHTHQPAEGRAVAPAPNTSFATRRHSCQWALAFLLCLLMGLP